MRNLLTVSHSCLVCASVASLVLAVGSASAAAETVAEVDTQALRQELSAERQKLAEQMRRLEAQMSDYQSQVDRIDDLERRLNASQAADGGLAGAPEDASQSGPAVAGSTATVFESEDAAATAQEQQAEDLESVSEDRVQLLAGEGRSDPYVDEGFGKSVPLFGSPWRVSFGGYAKADLIYDFSGTGNERQFLLATIPVDNDPPKGSYSNLQISETRFHFETRNTNPDFADNRFYLEWDFFNENTQSSPRLRHAYFEYGNLLAGQTWTLLTELRQLPQMLDFAAGDSLLGGRTEQIRWTQPNADKTFAWAVAVENFDDSSIFNPFDLQGTARSDYPRLTAGVTKLWDRVVWSTGGALTQVRFEGSDGVKDAKEAAYTLTTAGRLYVDDNKKNWLGYGLGYQAGSVTDVISFAEGQVPNAAIDADGNLDLTKAWNAQIGLHWDWNQSYASNFSVAYARLIDVPDLLEPDVIRAGWAYHANLIYKYNALLSGGLEFMYGERENVSGRDGDASRVQFSLMYYY